MRAPIGSALSHAEPHSLDGLDPPNTSRCPPRWCAATVGVSGDHPRRRGIRHARCSGWRGRILHAAQIGRAARVGIVAAEALDHAITFNRTALGPDQHDVVRAITSQGRRLENRDRSRRYRQDDHAARRCPRPGTALAITSSDLPTPRSPPRCCAAKRRCPWKPWPSFSTGTIGRLPAGCSRLATSSSSTRPAWSPPETSSASSTWWCATAPNSSWSATITKTTPALDVFARTAASRRAQFQAQRDCFAGWWDAHRAGSDAIMLAPDHATAWTLAVQAASRRRQRRRGPCTRHPGAYRRRRPDHRRRRLHRDSTQRPAPRLRARPMGPQPRPLAGPRHRRTQGTLDVATSVTVRGHQPADTLVAHHILPGPRHHDRRRPRPYRRRGPRRRHPRHVPRRALHRVAAADHANHAYAICEPDRPHAHSQTAAPATPLEVIARVTQRERPDGAAQPSSAEPSPRRKPRCHPCPHARSHSRATAPVHGPEHDALEPTATNSRAIGPVPSCEACTTPGTAPPWHRHSNPSRPRCKSNCNVTGARRRRVQWSSPRVARRRPAIANPGERLGRLFCARTLPNWPPMRF